MNKIQRDQKGFAHIIIVLIAVVVLGVGGYAVFRLIQEKNSTYTAENAEAKAAASSVKIKSLPIDIDDYDPATGRAGDIEFPKEPLQKGAIDLIFFDYGYVIDGSVNAQGVDKTNPQPTFRVAAGTKVRALIDGEVVAVVDLYSHDKSVHMRGKGSDLIFETEHVKNVTVKVGDQVTAGTVIAEASDYDSSKINGLSFIEIGVLKGGGAPTHLCTFDFLDDSIKDVTLKKITKLKKDWEDFRGDQTLYGDEQAIPGCVTRTPVTDNNNSQTGTTNN
jgi:biotin carboxyl carrier protein